MSTTQGIKLDEETTKRLKSLAQQRNRSAHWLMRTAILDYLDREERYEREKKEDMERWERYLFTGKVISEEEAESRLRGLIEG
jgi:predicted transcriptional regulator